MESSSIVGDSQQVPDLPTNTSTVTFSKKHKDEKLKNGKVKAKKIRGLFEDVAEQLAEMCRMLEKWPPEQVDVLKAKERKKKLKDQMKKTNKKLSKLNEAIPLCEVYEQSNLPVSLIEHMDKGGSPNIWLKELLSHARLENDQCRGELHALSLLRNTVSSMLENSQNPSTPVLPIELLQSIPLPDGTFSTTTTITQESELLS